MLNTPPTFALYIAGLVFQWLKKLGGLQAMGERNSAKAKMLYDYLDGSCSIATRSRRTTARA